MHKFVIIKDFNSKVKRFNLTARKLEFKLQPVPQSVEPLEWIKSGIEEIFRFATEELQPKDRVGITFCDTSFKRGPGWMNFQTAEKISVDDVWDLIHKVYQSNSEALSTETFCLGITTVRMPTGSGKDRARKYNSFEEESRSRRGIVTIDNKDNLCLARALVVAIAHVDKHHDYTKVRRDIGKLQTNRAKELVAEAGIIIPQEGAGIPEIQRLQKEHLSSYKIVVYEYGSKGREVIFEGPDAPKTLNLLYHKGHYNMISSLTAAFCTSYFCERCHVPYDHKNDHRCGGTCPCCQQSPACCYQEARIACSDCNRQFRGLQCYNNHKDQICHTIRRCESCLQTVRKDRKHFCGEIFCKTCRKHVPTDHRCFMQPDTRQPNVNDVIFIFYDLETRQDERIDQDIYLHIPNLCVFDQRCDNCINEKNLYFCQKCGFRRKILKEDVVKSFMEHLLKLRKKFKQVVVIAHNGQAFDHQFLFKYILESTDLKPELIMRGTKIILMQVENVKFIDSLNYFPMKLEALPKAFDLGPELKKGYFPHLFNTRKNENYAGSLPDMKYYSPDSMKEKDRETFLKWYEIHKYDQFDMQRDLVEYCISDVDILTNACLKFREMFLRECNVDPFTEATTIASACNLVYRRNFLIPDTIGLIPKGGYRWRDNQSKLAVQWLVWEEERGGINIQHAAKTKEVILNGVKVDGYCAETRQVFEFHGCYYHGCTSCYPSHRDKPLHENHDETLNSRYESTVAKTERLRHFKYQVFEMWECRFRKMLDENEEIRIMTENHPLLINLPLNPRDAFYGGRTDATKLYYKAKDYEKIKFIDVNSLYPFVCKYGAFGINHPIVYVGDAECRKLDLNITHGLVKCTIVPPQDLYHPVLPVKMNCKLMFILCRTCGEQMIRDVECQHTISQRSLTGVWVISEVVKAVQKGYQITNIHEIWSYNVSQYDRSTKTGGLFTEMMDKFIKMKQQASGWPAFCTDQTTKDRYVENFFNSEGIQMEPSQITKNAGLRSLAKLMLNSFW